MRNKWVLAPLALITVGAAVYGALTLTGRPAPNHAFFAADKPGVQVSAHRGGGGLRPENTLAAFMHAPEIGADILEMDVRGTADGAIVCLHDATVDRTTDGAGRVDVLRLSDLQKLDAGYRWSGDGGRTFPFRGQGIRVPTLEEVFARLPQARMNVEIKPAEPAFARSLCSLIRRLGKTEKVLIASMHNEALSAFRDACPEVATSMGPREVRIFVAAKFVHLTSAYSPAAVAMQIPYGAGDTVLATRDLVAAAQRRNLKVHVWTINEEQRMRELIALGVDGIITDRPDRLLGLLRRARSAP